MDGSLIYGEIKVSEIFDAANEYISHGIIIHPLSPPDDTKASPGKRPLLTKWQKLATNPTEEELENYFIKKNYNIGAVCGKTSDLMVVDVDWYIRGMWEDILRDIDVKEWVKQYRTSGRWHWLFKFHPDFKLKHAKPLGIDLLGESGNVVMSPSIHESGDVYTLDGNIGNRPALPDEVITRINTYIDTWQALRLTASKCRKPFKEFFERVFVKEDLGKDEDGNKIPNTLYHDLSVFRNMEGRTRTLHMCSELMANGADSKQMMLFCMMAFGNDFNYSDSEYQIGKINPSATARKSSIQADVILSQFFDASEQWVMDEKIEEDIKEKDIETFPKHIIEWANLLLEKGDAFLFIVDTWNRHHVGDRIIGEACACAVASTYMTNSKGLHIKPSGDSGKGKSDGAKKFLHLLPDHKKLVGSLSGKSMFYNPNLTKGTIIYTDDVQLNEDIVTTIKQSITNFQDITVHNTVKKQEYQQYTIPPRISWWMTSVSGFDDDQMGNRFLGVDVDSSSAQDEKVFQHQAIMERFGITEDAVDDDVLVCRAVFSILEEEDYKIVFPYTNCLEWNNKDNRRNFGMFMDILKSVTFYRVKQREKFQDLYLANIDDFHRAKEIYKGLAESNATNLTETELKVMRWISTQNDVDIKQITNIVGKSETTAKYLMHGRDGNGGLLAKVSGLHSEKVTIRHNDEKSTTKNIYWYDSNMGINSYEDVVNIDMECIDTEYKRFKEEYMALVSGKLAITSLSHHNHIKCDSDKTTTIDRIISTYTTTITYNNNKYNESDSSKDKYEYHNGNSQIGSELCESSTDSVNACDSDVIVCDSEMTLGEKMNLMREICATTSTFTDIKKKCLAVGFEQWHEIFTKMQESGEIMTDGENIKRV